jgi:hypothetical protein
MSEINAEPILKTEPISEPKTEPKTEQIPEPKTESKKIECNNTCLPTKK